MSEHNCGCGNCLDRLCVQRVPFLSALDRKELQKVTGLITHKHYLKGELLIISGQCNENLIIINQGMVKAFRYSRDGREQILYIFSVGDFFGESNLLRDQKTNYNVEALEETGICLIGKQDFQQLIRNYPEIGLKIMAELCNRLEGLENIIQNMGTNNVELRVNAVLMEFASKFGKDHPRGIMVELPLSRKLNLLQEEGIIETDGNKRIIVLDKEALEQSIE